MADSRREPVGGFRACLGHFTRENPVVQMYAEGTTAGIPWTFRGECRPVQTTPPVRGLLPFNCGGGLSGLAEQYAGGFISSSTLSAALGPDQPPYAYVPGYLSTSVVTLRLWKKPPAPASL